jgi:hypothetical protein
VEKWRSGEVEKWRSGEVEKWRSGEGADDSRTANSFFEMPFTKLHFK